MPRTTTRDQFLGKIHTFAFIHISLINLSFRRMINHECQRFNCHVYPLGTKDGFPQIEFRTVKKIKKDEEVFINYGKEYFNDDIVCECSTCGPKKKASQVNV